MSYNSCKCFQVRNILKTKNAVLSSQLVLCSIWRKIAFFEKVELEKKGEDLAGRKVTFKSEKKLLLYIKKENVQFFMEIFPFIHIKE